MYNKKFLFVHLPSESVLTFESVKGNIRLMQNVPIFLYPLVTLVTSTNKSVCRDIRIIHEMGKNGKQYLNIVHVCLHFVQQNT